MSQITAAHFTLLDLVNDAKTEEERAHRKTFLAGWRAGLESCGRTWSGIDADLHSMERYGAERPMCCGELMDWAPTERPQTEREALDGAIASINTEGETS